MRIYIASKYQKHIIINREITDVLTKNGFEVFLQESINNNGIIKNINSFHHFLIG